MKRSTERILTTHAGSMIRPAAVLDLTPETDEAVRTATLRTAMDALVLESFVLLKEAQPAAEDSTAWQQEFALD